MPQASAVRGGGLAFHVPRLLSLSARISMRPSRPAFFSTTGALLRVARNVVCVGRPSAPARRGRRARPAFGSCCRA